MNYYLTESLLNSLLHSNEKDKTKIEKKLSELLKKKGKFYISSFTIKEILINENDQTLRENLYQLIATLPEILLNHTSNDFNLALKLSRDQNLKFENYLELAICLNNSIDIILDSKDIFSKQNFVNWENALK